MKKKPAKILKSWNANKIKKFNFDNTINFYSQIRRNQNNQLGFMGNILVCSNFFSRNRLCLNPVKTLTQNLGFLKMPQILKPLKRYLILK